MKKGFENWTFLDYKKKVVFFRKTGFIDMVWQVPASQSEHAVFMENFYSKGRESCKFSEFKNFHFLDGRRKNFRTYGTIYLTKSQYANLAMLADDLSKDSLSDLLNELIYRYHDLSKCDNESAEVTRKLLKTIHDFTKNVSKLIVNT